MKELTQWLDKYSEIVDTYDSLEWNDGKEVSALMKDLGIVLSHLEFLRSNYHKAWTAVCHSEKTVAAGEREADLQVPELYLLRRVMTAGYRVLDVMRSNISYIKKES